MPKFLASIILLTCFFKSPASTIDKAYKALKEYDYFKAKKLFYSQLKKNKVEAAYGLATIYYRNDNPFFKLDSAYKYVLICRDGFKELPVEKMAGLKLTYAICDSVIHNLHDSVCQKAYLALLKKVNIESTETYATVFYQSRYVYDVLCKRDSLVFNAIKNNSQSAVITNYINQYPQSCYLQKAWQLFDYNTYREITSTGNDAAYLSYIKQYNHTQYTQQAKEELLAYYIKNKNASGIYYYIKNIKASYYAWSMLFSIEIKDYNEESLLQFLNKYPDYPDKKQLEEEFMYWKMPLLSIKKEGKYGFTDTSGKVVIEPVYDDAESFQEGYALVEKNNVYGYINKVGRVKIDFTYEDASSFFQQAAIVRKNKETYLIDHAEKKVSGIYDEIADFADHTAIVKKNNAYGAINQDGEEIIKPTFLYLSDFSENVASFMQNNTYGFINKQGFTVIAPLFNWVSAFKDNQCRIKMNNHFGLINKKGDFIIDPLYDFIDEAYKGIYLVVKNNLYGFVDSSGCYLTEIKYTYNPSLKVSDLTNGMLMRLIKNNKEEVQDKDGIRYFSQDNISQVQLGDKEMIATCKRNKCQLYNLNKVSLLKTTYTNIHTDKKYWYCINDKGCSAYTIDLKKKLFTIPADDATLISPGLFSYTIGNGTGLVNQSGAILLEAFFDEVTPTQVTNIFYVERKEKGAYYNISTFKFIWQENGFNAAYIADEE